MSMQDFLDKTKNFLFDQLLERGNQLADLINRNEANSIEKWRNFEQANQKRWQEIKTKSNERWEQLFNREKQNQEDFIRLQASLSDHIRMMLNQNQDTQYRQQIVEQSIIPVQNPYGRQNLDFQTNLIQLLSSGSQMQQSLPINLSRQQQHQIIPQSNQWVSIPLSQFQQLLQFQNQELQASQQYQAPQGAK